MSRSSEQLTLSFAFLGHALMHLLTACFFVIALALERDWVRPYHEVIELWTPGALMVGLLALPAGWLADRWSAPGMIALMFVGMGLACGLCAASDSPPGLLGGLVALGIFAAIYHPVGIPWVVRNASARGKALGVNGIAGGLGVASAGTVAGGLVDWIGWRGAFGVLGAVSLLTGLALVLFIAGGKVRDRQREETEAAPRGRSEMIRAFAILLFTMFCVGFVYQAGQAAFPKVFETRLGDALGTGTIGVGLVVTSVYGSAALMQFVGGHLADRFPLKPVYLISLLLQVPVLTALAGALGAPLVLGAAVAVLLSTGALPAENMLLARNSPRGHQGLVFGLKFVLALGAAPLAIAFVAWINGATGGFEWLFFALAGVTLLAALAAAMLPGERTGVAAAD